MSPGEKREANELLAATLDSPGWKMIILPALTQRLADARVQLEDGRTLTLEQLRDLQVQIRLLREFVEQPMEAFG